ncbi:MAG: hypothetical protein WCI67_17490 [Chloroflexales bacterium]
MEHVGAGIQGIYRDRLVGADGRLIYDSGWSSNTIMASFRVLLAAFLSHDTTMIKHPGHLLVLMVGSGDSAWDTPSGPTAADPAGSGLLNPHTVRVRDLQLAYLDEQDQETTVPSNRLQITATIDNRIQLDNPYPLREFGLFVQFADTAQTLSIVNCVRHRLIYKTASDTLTRQIRLTF